MTLKLPQNQLVIFESLNQTGETSPIQITTKTGLKLEQVSGALFALEELDLISIKTTTISEVSLTKEGDKYHQNLLPELRLYEGIKKLKTNTNELNLSDAIKKSNLEKQEVNIALSNYARKKFGEIHQGNITIENNIVLEQDSEQLALDSIKHGIEITPQLLKRLESRDLLEIILRSHMFVTLTEKGLQIHEEGVQISHKVTHLTPQMLATGKWENIEYTEYNVEADTAPHLGGRTHILRETAEKVKDVFVGMGFQEMEGPHIDSEFWINDCLFMPQDHPARTHWDQFALDLPLAKNLPKDLVEKVKNAHLTGVGEYGTGYHSPWSENVARGVDLRGHTTSLSMRYLSGTSIGKLQPPQRFFSVEKVYRNDTLDSTHLLEFFQIEGWVMAETLSVRDLMGTFTEFYRQFGITNLKFKPHYNPYTEPSFEIFGEHPRTGDLIEIGNSGLFREEVLRPLGIDCSVMAWGLALERLLMLIYGFEDIRDIHGTSCDLKLLRSTEVLY